MGFEMLNLAYVILVIVASLSFKEVQSFRVSSSFVRADDHVRRTRQANDGGPGIGGGGRGDPELKVVGTKPSPLYNFTVMEDASIFDKGNGTANATQSNSTKEPSFAEAFLKCLPKIKMCPLVALPASTCSLACLFDQSPAHKRIIFVLPKVVNELCHELGSSLDHGLRALEEEAEATGGYVKRFRSYISILGVTKSTENAVATMSGQSMPIRFIQYAKGPVFDALKPVLASIHSSISGTTTIFEAHTDMQSDTHCKRTDLTPAVMTLTEAIINNPGAADIVLPGYFTLSALLTLQIDTHISHIAAIFHAMTLLGGIQCSAVRYAYTGNRIATCNTTMPRNPRYFQAQPKVYDVCGPAYNPKLMDMHKFFPGSFNIEDAERLEEQEVIYDDGVESNILPNSLFNEHIVQEVTGPVDNVLKPIKPKP